MARKGLLSSITSARLPTTEMLATSSTMDARAAYANRGASRAMMQSLEEMAEQSKLLASGEVVVELDPNLIDDSFISDRVEDDDEEFAALKQAIEERGQLQPILVRPHPYTTGRHMVVFGHRRRRAAKELGKPVRAIIRALDDVSHIVAQGQENAQRSNLSFIEKARFAESLRVLGHNTQTILAAIGADKTLLSRMLAVIDGVPSEVLEALGAAKTVGRDRWEDLKKMLASHPTRAETARAVVRSEDFLKHESQARFGYLVERIKKAHRPAPKAKASAGQWTPSDSRVVASYQNTGRTFSLSLKSKDAGEFGEFISTNLEKLYRDFREAKPRNQGD
ncbi:MAG: plasmid partitioning protein RepB [Stutzerimonas stutzeri]|nr:MAG: plasmid partitioning protein RepB [Stutzerimonas stutzeri]